MNAKGFDRISFLYDKLALLVYGRSIVDAQKYFLTQIPQQAKVLILGGGTGWILTEIGKNKITCEIWYIDASEEMIRLSGTKINPNRTYYIRGTEKDIPASVSFDVVITNFYLDLFSDEKLKEVLGTIKHGLSAEVKWIATDFVNTKKWWQSTLLTIMYLFFNVVCAIEARSLPDWDKALHQAGLRRRESKFFYRGFIESTVYTISGTKE